MKEKNTGEKEVCERLMCGSFACKYVCRMREFGHGKSKDEESNGFAVSLFRRDFKEPQPLTH